MPMVPKIKLADNNQMPQVGLGLWQSTDEDAFINAFNVAIEAGYRHFDTAQAYSNEQMLGKAWKASGIKRSDLFITTKINIKNFSKNKVASSFRESLEKLQTDYVDLLLLHFPVTVLRKNAWTALEEIHSSNQAKSIGVSNYTTRHLEELFEYAKTKPVVNQVELHIFLQQPELRQFCKQNNIQVEAYSPLARAHILDNPVVQKIADKHSKTYTQVMLRWLIDNDLVIIPKSVTPSRIRENIDLFDFKLDKQDLDELEKVDKDKRFCWSPVHVP
jgi:diketogulonate reductase-like aldo/keto reductase